MTDKWWGVCVDVLLIRWRLLLPADGSLEAQRTGEPFEEDAEQSPVSLLQRNVTLYTSLEAGRSLRRRVTTHVTRRRWRAVAHAPGDVTRRLFGKERECSMIVQLFHHGMVDGPLPFSFNSLNMKQNIKV